MFEELKISIDDKKILGIRKASTAKCKRLLKLAQDQNTAHAQRKRFAFEALEEVERLGNSQVTVKIESLVQETLRTLHEIYQKQPNWHCSHNAVEKAIEEGVGKMKQEYKYASGTFRHLFYDSAEQEFMYSKEDFELIKYLCLNRLRLDKLDIDAEEYPEARKRDAYRHLIMLMAACIALGQYNMAIDVQQFARTLVDVSRISASSVLWETEFCWRAFEKALVILLDSRDLQTARSLAEALVLQTDNPNPCERDNAYTRMVIRLGRVCVEQGDIAGAKLCIERLGGSCDVSLSPEAELAFIKSSFAMMATSQGITF